MYYCEICNKEFKTAGNLAKHKKYTHSSSIEKIECKYCGKLFLPNGIKFHELKCSLNPAKVLTEAQKLDKIKKDIRRNGPFFCKHCKNEFKNYNSLIQHEIRCKDNKDRIFNSEKHKKSIKKNICACKYCNRLFNYLNAKNTHEKYCKLNPNAEHGWSFGLTAENNKSIAKMSSALKGKGHAQSLHTREKLREYALENPHLGHPFKHIVEYNGFKFDSTYEVDLAKDLDLNSIIWEKSKRFLYHDLQGNRHYYTPDFYLPEYDIYLDPKNDFLINNINPATGYSDIDKISWVCSENNIKVFILDKTQLSWVSIKKLINGE